MEIIDFTDSIYDAQQSDPLAIKFIYDNTIQLFYKEACAFMRKKNDADAAVRDAYLFIFDHLNSLEDTSKFLLWANEVCKNTCISKLKQAGVFEEAIPPEAINLGEILSAEEFDSQINTQATMMPEHIQVCLEAVLNSLPDNQRVCAILWGEGYPVRSIARKLGLSSTAVNYILACTLGNITNAVNTLSENGLPLYSMEPIPFFLWLLISYYQCYHPEDTSLGYESDFANILRILMPGEASAFLSNFSETVFEEREDITVRVEEQFDTVSDGIDYDHSAAGEDSENDIELEDFINPSAAVSGDAFDFSDFISPDKAAAADTAEENAAAKDSSAVNAEKSSIEESSESEANDTSSADSESKNAADGMEVSDMEAANDKSADSDDSLKKETDSSAAAADESVENFLSDSDLENMIRSDDSPSLPPMDIYPAHSEGTNSAKAQAAAATAGNFELSEFIKENETPKKKKKTGLIITLIIIFIVLCLIAAAFIFYGDYVKDKINTLLGTTIFTSSTVEPEAEEAEAEETAEPATEETTEPATETTTEAPTTEEATTEDLSTFKVSIYADGSSLSMKDAPNGNGLLYVASEAEVVVDEVSDGWGHITYPDNDGVEQSGWIWLGYTKVVGNAPVEQPAEMLETPEDITVHDANELAELKTGPGNGYSTFGPIPDGTEVTAEAYQDNYAYVYYDGHYGWVSLDNVW